jgi:hypothetical protein
MSSRKRVTAGTDRDTEQLAILPLGCGEGDVAGDVDLQTGDKMVSEGPNETHEGKTDLSAGEEAGQVERRLGRNRHLVDGDPERASDE